MFIHFQNNAASIVINCKRVGEISRTLKTAIMQFRIFSLNLGTSNQNFETNKFSLVRFFQKEEYHSNFFSEIFLKNTAF